MNVLERMEHFSVQGVSTIYFSEGKIMGIKHFGVLEKNTNRLVDDKSIFHACSISKMVTAICVLRLAQDGVLDLHSDVNNYLASWKIKGNQFTSAKKVTLANILAHQAGFYDCKGSFNPYKKGDITSNNLDILKGTTHHHAEEASVKYAPETDFSYSDLGYCIISQVLEDVLGETIQQVAKRIVFEPLGLKSTFFWQLGDVLLNKVDISLENCAVGHDRNGEIVDEIRAYYPNVEGAGLWTTTNELAQIVIDIVNGYHGNDGAILNQRMARFMLSPYGCSDDVGMGIFLGKNKDGEAFFISQGWGAGMQCKLQVDYKNQSGIIVMTNSEPGMEQNKSLVGEIIRFVADGGVAWT